METKLDYELWIKGRKAEVGSKLWLDDGDGELKEVAISKIAILDFQNPQISIRDENNKWHFFRIDDLGIINKCLFWEKPIIYQLPDTDRNLSEVKVGQEVWVSNKTINKIWEAKIIGLDKNLGIFLRYINHKYKGHITTPNITGKESFLKVTTNKPSRFHGKQDWSQAPEKSVAWGIDRDGYAYWYFSKQITEGYNYWSTNDWKQAGYRNDLINDRENMEVTDWRDSLVMRPKDV